MTQLITATFIDGVFKPVERILIPSGTRVRLTLEPVENELEDAVTACDHLDQLCDAFPIDSEGKRLTRDELHDRT